MLKLLTFIGSIMLSCNAISQQASLRFSAELLALKKPIFYKSGPTQKLAFLPSGASVSVSNPPALPALYNLTTMAFFCKMECKMEKSAGFPVKFRLGSVDYVDGLEMKRISSPSDKVPR